MLGMAKERSTAVGSFRCASLVWSGVAPLPYYVHQKGLGLPKQCLEACNATMVQMIWQTRNQICRAQRMPARENCGAVSQALVSTLQYKTRTIDTTNYKHLLQIPTQENGWERSLKHTKLEMHDCAVRGHMLLHTASHSVQTCMQPARLMYLDAARTGTPCSAHKHICSSG